MLLLMAIMAVGVVGLTFSYGTRNGHAPSVSASANDTSGSDGKVQSDRMILNLNQKNSESKKSNDSTNF